MLRNGLEPWHLIILLAIVLLAVGGTKLPELARGMGRSIRIFKAEVGAPEIEAASSEAVKAEEAK